jgi:hypothetical protein
MKYAAAILCAILTCCAQSADAVIPADPPEAVVKQLGAQVIEMLKSAESIEVFRVGKIDTEGTTPEFVGLRQTLKEGRKMPLDYMYKVIAAMLSENTYTKQDSKGTVVGMGYRIKLKDGGRVELSCCLSKGNVQIAAFDAAGKVIKKGDARGFREDKSHPLRFLSIEAFPDDEDIKKVTPKPIASEPKNEPAIIPPVSVAPKSAPVPELPAKAEGPLPPGWLPVQRLDAATPWSSVREVKDRIQLYLPAHGGTVRGIFVCFVFHSADPRELAEHWNFALVTVPSPFEYDIGYHDKRNERPRITGLPVGNTSVLLDYLTAAAKETNHPELAVAPFVGWVGQNGGTIVNDLLQRAPGRVIAWADSFPKPLQSKPDVTKTIPFALAWELGKTDEQRRNSLLAESKPEGATPPPNFTCEATTYGFPHGIYSKFFFFMAYLDRCILTRLPSEIPPPGTRTELKPIALEEGWAGDYTPVSEWNPIAPCKDAKGMIQPMWLPDEYSAWMWRSYHSANPDLKLTAPVIEYRKKDGKWGGSECGLGYGNIVSSQNPLRFAAETKGAFTRLEFHDGNRVIGTASAAPYEIEGIKLAPGLHALFVVGVSADGSRQASRPAFLIVK